jgi:hypothetical protein
MFELRDVQSCGSPEMKKPPDAAASTFRHYDCAYFSWVEMLVNLVFRLVPIVLTTAMMATEMPAAIRPYSMAVAPDSFLRNATILDIRDAPGFSLTDASGMKVPLSGKEFLLPIRRTGVNKTLRSWSWHGRYAIAGYAPGGDLGLKRKSRQRGRLFPSNRKSIT